MRKKISFVVILFICFFFNIKSFKAEVYDCAYKVSFGKNYTFSVTFDTEKQTLKFSNLCWNNGVLCRGGSVSELDNLLIESDATLTDAKDELLKQRKENLFSGNCDSTLLVFYYWSNGAQHEYLKVLFNDTLEANAREYMKAGFGSGTYKELTDEWSEFNADKSTAPSKDIAYNCDAYKTLFGKIESSAQLIKDCDSNCSILYGDYENAKLKLKDFCVVQFKHLDFGESCLSACLNSQEQIEELGVEKLSNPSQCSFSKRLFSYVANIVKWLKYIIPVIVMVLGILDFIKAIASEKDDEMKKAQGHFIKRLIAAALIFIIPAIIEFVLIKMGFEYDTCGLF